jgi:acetyl esterase/lipase
MRRWRTGCLLAAALGAALSSASQELMTSKDLASLPQPPADRTVAYGDGPQQFGELRLPGGTGPHPVAIVIHGGCWQAPYGLDHVRSLCASLTGAGVATWSLEYRRLGDAGGGWPGTFEDVAQGADFVRRLALSHPLDLDRVVAVGHSAGGHLALWLAARRRLPAASVFRGEDPLRLRAVVSLAGIADLRDAAARPICGEAPIQLLGGRPEQVPERLRIASPVESLPFGVAQTLVFGALDRIVPPEHGRLHLEAATRAGDAAALRILEGCGHFELIHPASRAWPDVRGAVLAAAAVR